jgi:hypothetical protein
VDAGHVREDEQMAQNALDDWVVALSDELGVDLTVDTRLLLDVARDAAHNVDRPAAPLTTFLLGYAAATRGGGVEAVADAADRARRLALSWSSTAGRHADQAESGGSAGSGESGSP